MNFFIVSLILLVSFSSCIDYKKNSKSSDISQNDTALISEAQEYYELGNKKFFEDKYNEALTYYDKAITLHPKFTYAIYNRSFVYEILGDTTRKISELTKVINIDSTLGEAYFYRGKAYRFYKKYDLALSDFDNSIKYNYSVDEAWVKKAVIYTYLNDTSLALSAYNRAIELAPDYYKHYFERGYFYLEIKDTTKACKDFEASKELGLKENEQLEFINSICK